jgi:predicted aconitase
MHLTREEERILGGGEGKGVQKALRILVALGDIYGADSLIPVKSVQVAGVSYKNLGEEGTMFLEELVDEGAKVREGVTATLNPSGSDLVDWAKTGFREDLAGKQKRIIDAYKAMGVLPTCTCLPYESGFAPEFGEHIAWAESSCVIYANSVIGARTNREGGPSALAAAIVGKTPNYGLHLDENRAPTVEVNVEAEIKDADYGVLGWVIGKTVKKGIPYVKGLKNPSKTDLKYFGAGMAAGGQIGLYHVEGVTPEAGDYSTADEEITLGVAELKDGYDKLNTIKGDEDMIYLGCPHLSIEELREAARLLKNKKVRKRLILVTSRIIKEKASREGVVKTIENAGGEVYADMCLVIGSIEKLGVRNLVTNTGKGAHYLPHYAGVGVRILSTRDCILEALK